MGDTSRPKVLVVDDEDAIRHILSSLLGLNNCEVRIAASAEQAHEVLESWNPEVALVDIVMPGSSGLELLRDMKSRGLDTEVLIMTSNPSADTAVKALREGAYDYLKKPFDLKTVWDNVQRALGSRTLAVKNRELQDEQEQRSQELSAEVALDKDERDDDRPVYADVLTHILEVVVKELDVKRVSVMLLDEESRELKIEASHGIPEHVIEGTRVQLGSGISGSVALTGEPFVVTDITTDDRVGKPQHSISSDSFISAPILLSVAIRSDSRILGVINATDRRSGEPFGPDDVEFVTRLASQLAVALEGTARSEKLQKAYQLLKATQNQLVFAEKLTAVGKMASGVAHDFNNVLCVILGRAEFLLRKLGDVDAGSDLRSDVETIIKASRQGAEAIKRIQDYTRVRKDAPVGSVDIDAVIQDAIEIAKPKWKLQCQIENKPVDIRLELNDVPPVCGNEQELSQVVNNLIFNAVEAMPNGGVLTFRTRSSDDHVTFEVQDTGVGMDEETRDRLFDPFFTTKESGQGLGTAIIYGIVTRHKGEIHVDTKPGRGSTFRVTLPRHTTPIDAIAEPTTHSDAERRSARVLFVDDEDMVREMYEEALQLGGHKVAAAGGGHSALESFEKDKFDLVITDLNMDDMTGLALAGRLKEIDPSIPVILLSGWAMQQDDTLRKAGIDKVLLKPCSIEDLLGAIQGTARNCATVSNQTP